MKGLLFYPGGVLYLDHDLGQDIFPDTGGCKDMGGSDLPLVMECCSGAFRTVDGKSGRQGLAVGEHMVPDPGHREIGHDIFRLIQIVPFKKSAGTIGDHAVGYHDALWITGGT